MLKGVIFDVDGTLLDSVDQHAKAWQDAFKKWGKDVDFDAVRHQIGKGGDQLMPVFLSEDEVESFGEEMSSWRTKHYLEHYLPSVKTFPGVRELLQAVSERGKKVALASSAKSEELGQYKKIMGVDDLLDAETTQSDVERSKPFPDIFAAALEKIGLPASEAIAIGDTPYDIAAAGKIALKTIGVLSGGFHPDMLQNAGAVAIYRDPEDLLDRIDEWLS